MGIDPNSATIDEAPPVIRRHRVSAFQFRAQRKGAKRAVARTTRKIFAKRQTLALTHLVKARQYDVARASLNTCGASLKTGVDKGKESNSTGQLGRR